MRAVTDNVGKSLVEMHGRTVEVFSEGANCGSRFTLTIPVGNAVMQGDDTLNYVLPTHELRSCRVLVVDDHKAAVDMLSQVCANAWARSARCQ